MADIARSHQEWFRESCMQYPAWYHVINPVFSGTHAEVELSESSSDMSFRITPLNDERNIIKSSVQALSSLASGLKKLAESQMKRDKLTMQYEKERDDNYLKFREEEARKAREHEYRMACLFAGSNPTNRPHTNIQSTPQVSSACSYGS